MRYLFLVLQLLLLLPSSVHSQRHLDTAKSYLGTVELTGNNDGAKIEKFLQSVGRKKGDSWCAAFVSYCLESAKVKYPKVKSGLARHFKLKNSVKANDVLIGKYKIKPGSIVIWEKGNTIFGHVGFVVNWKKYDGTTIEGNTSSGKAGSQSDGDGIYLRYRIIQPANYFRITSFTEVIE